jgi:thioredoxin 1
MEVLHLNEKDFDKAVLEADLPVVVDFWATWCGPCQMMAPVVEGIAEHRDDLIVAKVDVDEAPALAARYGVSSIPTLMLFSEGKPAAKAIGYMDEQSLLERLGI